MNNQSPHEKKDLVCFSHLRWNFLYQRPQHLMSGFAKSFRVFFIEEPVMNAATDKLETSLSEEKVWIVVPHLLGDYSRPDVFIRIQELVEALFESERISQYLFWYYSPVALKYSREFTPSFVIYDCMFELSASSGASLELKDIEKELMGRADVVFAGGQSLYEAKRKYHPETYLLASSIDCHHFNKARVVQADPPDQWDISRPRLGFFGVIDERLDIQFLETVARLRPHWQFIMIGPVVKLDPLSLPRFPNIHYLGSKSYKELPEYIAGWDIALIPFAHNEATRYISPAKTPEYLAAGKPVISTPIIDVIRPYGNKKLVRIAGTSEEFVKVAEEELAVSDRSEWLARVDGMLNGFSWNQTIEEMQRIIREKMAGKVAAIEQVKGEEIV